MLPRQRRLAATVVCFALLSAASASAQISEPGPTGGNACQPISGTPRLPASIGSSWTAWAYSSPYFSSIWALPTQSVGWQPASASVRKTRRR
jgi:hypothetical protein